MNFIMIFGHTFLLKLKDIRIILNNVRAVFTEKITEIVQKNVG